MADKLHFFVGNCSVQTLRIQARNRERGKNRRRESGLQGLPRPRCVALGSRAHTSLSPPANEEGYTPPLSQPCPEDELECRWHQ